MWLLVCCLYKEVYLQIFKCVSFWLHGCCGEWEGGPVNQVNHTSWVAVVTSTDRPKSVRNCCLIELFNGVVCVVTLPFSHFCWCMGFCHRTGSDLLLFVFRTLNKIVRPVSYPLPLIDDILSLLGNARHFTALDLKSGYWQVQLDDDSKEKTVFASHRGLFQFNVMPFGLSNAPAVL